MRLCCLFFCRKFCWETEVSLIAVQLLPNEIKIGFEFGCISSVERRVFFEREGQRDCLLYGGRSFGENDYPVSQADCLGKIMCDEDGCFLFFFDNLSNVISYSEPSLIIKS
mgnify:CR=1 FL=1